MLRDVVQELAQLMTKNLKLDSSSVSAETALFEGGLELDSFAVVELVTMLETHFGIQIGDDDFVPENFTDVKTLAGVIEKYLPATTS